LTELNGELRSMDVKARCVCRRRSNVDRLSGRPDTEDVDAVFEPVRYIRMAARKGCQRNGLEIGWLNDASRDLSRAA